MPLVTSAPYVALSGNEAVTPFFRQFPVMLQIVDHMGRLVDVSDHWLHVLGYTRANVIGASFGDFLTPATRHLTEVLYLPELLEKGQIQQVECEFAKQNGERLIVLASATAERNKDGAITHYFVALQDISQQKRSETMLQKIAKVTATVTGDHYFQTLVSHLVRAFDVRTAFVTECADQTLTSVRTLAYCESHRLLDNIQYNLADTPCQEVIHGSLRYYPEKLALRYPREAGMESYLGVPFFDSHGKILGHLAILDDKPLRCDVHDVALLEIFAARTGAELECKIKAKALRHSTDALNHYYAQLQDQNRHLEQLVIERTHEIERRQRVAESLRDMLLILNSNSPRQAILEYVVKAATKLLDTDSGAIYLLQPEEQHLTIQAAYGLPVAYVENLNLSLHKSFVGQSLLTRKPVIITNIADAVADHSVEADANKRNLLTQHYCTYLAVPLLHQTGQSEGAESYGALALYFREQRELADEEIRLVVALGVQVALILENAELRQQVQQTAIREERSRLARELHDSVTQSLYSLTLLTEGWRRMLQSGQMNGMNDALLELGQISQQALKEMRLLVYELRPPLLEKEGLLGALHQRLNAVEKRAGIEARVVADALIDLPPAVEECLYRIAQEALNNTLKHAAATTIHIALSCRNDFVCLEVTDNGKGFDLTLEQQFSGIGMSSMRERAEQLGGTLKIHSAPGQGTTVWAELALKS